MKRASHEIAIASSFDVYTGRTGIAAVLRHRRPCAGVLLTLQEAHLGFAERFRSSVAVLRGLDAALAARVPSLRIYCQDTPLARRLRRDSVNGELPTDELEQRIHARLLELDHFTIVGIGRPRLGYFRSLARIARELSADDSLYASMSSSWRGNHPTEPVRSRRGTVGHAEPFELHPVDVDDPFICEDPDDPDIPF